MGSLFYPDAYVCLDRWRAFDLDGYRPRACSQIKPIAQRFEKHFGIKATIEAPEKITDSFSLYKRMAKDSVLVRELKVCVDYGEVMPNIPQMARFFTYVGAALQIATEGRASAEAALREAEANLRRP